MQDARPLPSRPRDEPASLRDVAHARYGGTASALPRAAPPPPGQSRHAASVPAWRTIRAQYLLQRSRPAVAIAALLLLFTFLASQTVPTISAQDEGSILAGAKALLAHGSIRAGDDLNDRYDTNLIGNVFASYRGPDEMYYRAFPGSILLAAPFVWASGDTGFFLMGPLFGALAVAAVGAIAFRLTRSFLLAALSAGLFATAPVFVNWAVTAFNNMPVLALQLWALWFLLREDAPTRRDTVVAGALFGLGLLIRTTELVFVAPFLLLIYARTGRWSRAAAFCLPILASGLVLLVLDTWLFGSPLYQPHAAPLYLAPGDAAGGSGVLAAVSRYLLFLLGASDYSSLHVLQLPAHYWFHVRYLLSSTYAFPLLAPGLLGLAIAGWNRWPGARGLLLFASAYAVLLVLFYGNQQQNYYGYGREIVRSSFIRYALPLYALTALGIAVFLARCFLSREPELRSAFMAFACGLLVIGSYGSLQLAKSEEIFGLDRLNRIRETTLHEREAVGRLLGGLDAEPVLIVGVNTSKVPDLDEQHHVVDIVGLTPDDIDAELLPVIDRAVGERPVAFLGSSAKQDEAFVATLEERYRLTTFPLDVDTLYVVEGPTQAGAR